MIVDHAGDSFSIGCQITADSWACEYDIRYDIIHILASIYTYIYICMYTYEIQKMGVPQTIQVAGDLIF